MGWLLFREPVSAWTHLLWMLFSLPGTWVLWRLSRGDRVKQVGLLIFGLGLVACYGGSALFHAVPARFARVCNKLDHIGIYLLIAATGTPIALIVLRGRWRVGLLACIWGLALTGISLCLGGDMPLAPRTAFYLLMGWIGCTTYFELARRLSLRKMGSLFLGGVFYTVGAVINLAGWPALAPGLFGAHELFHLFVMAGSLCHYYFMLDALVPFERVEAEVPAEVSAEEPVPFPPALARQPAEG